jgi:hypothetical protein
VQVPVVRNVITKPETVHTLGVELVRVTARFDDAVGATVRVFPESSWSNGWAYVIV